MLRTEAPRAGLVSHPMKISQSTYRAVWCTWMPGGDGIDSNGRLNISGGEIYVSGAANGGNGALDYDSQAVITGGTFVSAGYSQMAQNFSTSSTQGAILVSVGTQPANTVITLADESGRELISYTSPKSYDCVQISCAQLAEGSTYTLTVNGESSAITMDSLIYGGMPGGMGGGRGGMQDGRNGGRGGAPQE